MELLYGHKERWSGMNDLKFVIAVLLTSVCAIGAFYFGMRVVEGDINALPALVTNCMAVGAGLVRIFDRILE